MKITELNEARYHGSNFPLFYVIYDPHWESRAHRYDNGPFLFFDMGVQHSVGKDIGKRKTGTFDTQEAAEAMLTKWRKYYSKRSAKRFTSKHYKHTKRDRKRWDDEERVAVDAKVGVVELKF